MAPAEAKCWLSASNIGRGGGGGEGGPRGGGGVSPPLLLRCTAVRIHHCPQPSRCRGYGVPCHRHVALEMPPPRTVPHRHRPLPPPGHCHVCMRREEGGGGGGWPDPPSSYAPPPPTRRQRLRKIVLRLNPLVPKAQKQLLPQTVEGEEEGGLRGGLLLRPNTPLRTSTGRACSFVAHAGVARASAGHNGGGGCAVPAPLFLALPPPPRFCGGLLPFPPPPKTSPWAASGAPAVARRSPGGRQTGGPPRAHTRHHDHEGRVPGLPEEQVTGGVGGGHEGLGADPEHEALGKLIGVHQEVHQLRVRVCEELGVQLHRHGGGGGTGNAPSAPPPRPPRALIRPSGEDAHGQKFHSASPPPPPDRGMPAAVRMSACHGRRFKGERPIGAATGQQSQPLRPCARPPPPPPARDGPAAPRHRLAAPQASGHKRGRHPPSADVRKAGPPPPPLTPAPPPAPEGDSEGGRFGGGATSGSRAKSSCARGFSDSVFDVPKVRFSWGPADHIRWGIALDCDCYCAGGGGGAVPNFHDPSPCPCPKGPHAPPPSPPPPLRGHHLPRGKERGAEREG